MKVTAKEFAAKQGIDQLEAKAVLVFLVAKGQASLLDEKRKSDSGHGRSSAVYEVPETVTLNF